MTTSVSAPKDNPQVCKILCSVIGYAGLTHSLTIGVIFLHHTLSDKRMINPTLSKVMVAAALPFFFIMNLIEALFRAVITLPILAVCLPLNLCIKNRQLKQFVTKFKIQLGMAILGSIANIAVFMYSQFKNRKTTEQLLLNNLKSIGKCLMVKSEIKEIADKINKQKK